MGRWNRRYLYLPRVKHRNYDYEDPPDYCPDDSSAGNGNNRVPSWEIEYCKSAKVPWNKVLASKKYICCYPSVLHWDASAGKEALEDSKQRYWANINGLPCDNPLPDPDMYIEEIDWNAYVDPKLMEDLDSQFFNPDESCSVDRLETITQVAASSQVLDDKKQQDVGNPWEQSILQASDSLKDSAQGWGTWGNSINLKTESPWEQNCTQTVDPWKDNAWNNGKESRGWDQGRSNNLWSNPVTDCGNQTRAAKQEGWGQKKVNHRGWDQGHSNNVRPNAVADYGNQSTAIRQEGWRHREVNHRSWNQGQSNEFRPNAGAAWGNQTTAGRQEGWGQKEVNSQGWDQNIASGLNPRNIGGDGNSWENKNYADSNGRDGTDSGSHSRGWRDSEFQVGDTNHWDSSNIKRTGGSFRGSCRKRESSVQHTSKFKSTRYQGYNYRDNRQM